MSILHSPWHDTLPTQVIGSHHGGQQQHGGQLNTEQVGSEKRHSHLFGLYLPSASELSAGVAEQIEQLSSQDHCQDTRANPHPWL
jgi:hypothetical protein